MIASPAVVAPSPAGSAMQPHAAQPAVATALSAPSSPASGAVPATGPDASAPNTPPPFARTDESGLAFQPAAPQPLLPRPAPLPQDRAPLRSSTQDPYSWKEFQDNILYEHKRHYLLDLLTWAHGSVPDAAKAAGLSRQRLYTLLKEHGITRHWEKK